MLKLSFGEQPVRVSIIDSFTAEERIYYVVEVMITRKESPDQVLMDVRRKQFVLPSVSWEAFVWELKKINPKIVGGEL